MIVHGTHLTSTIHARVPESSQRRSTAQLRSRKGTANIRQGRLHSVCVAALWALCASATIKRPHHNNPHSEGDSVAASAAGSAALPWSAAFTASDATAYHRVASSVPSSMSGVRYGSARASPSL